ncbi:hypothetical protein [Amycolatopsis rubida]|uniref:Uncharacterized protein n=1 Tax=Amycolatopsis rubida TaxID=112413 RepID=A0A1I6BMC7_9PSEU|nr:hypothetical protein [Amycolatopsis rubida]SFQ82070.1 hypothetical protein SAMN05421854_1332 [Amycolatopsis rubida]
MRYRSPGSPEFLRAQPPAIRCPSPKPVWLDLSQAGPINSAAISLTKPLALDGRIPVVLTMMARTASGTDIGWVALHAGNAPADACAQGQWVPRAALTPRRQIDE